jgi:hypothetical protein
MQSDKATLKEASDGIKSQKLNDHRGYWRLYMSLTCVSMRQVNPNKASRRKPKYCFQTIKTTHDFFKGSLSNISYLRQVMLQQNH